MKETVKEQENKSRMSERDDIIKIMSKKRTRIGVAPPAYKMNRFVQINKQTSEEEEEEKKTAAAAFTEHMIIVKSLLIRSVYLMQGKQTPLNIEANAAC